MEDIKEKTCGIKKLKMLSNALYWEVPNNKMLMDKINEIIDYLDNQINYKVLGDE